MRNRLKNLDNLGENRTSSAMQRLHGYTICNEFSNTNVIHGQIVFLWPSFVVASLRLFDEVVPMGCKFSVVYTTSILYVS